MSANEKVVPYRILETSAEFRCSRCQKIIYTESILEEVDKDTNTITAKRICVGSFYQAIDEESNPSGPIIPFCNCGEK